MNERNKIPNEFLTTDKVIEQKYNMRICVIHIAACYMPF